MRTWHGSHVSKTKGTGVVPVYKYQCHSLKYLKRGLWQQQQVVLTNKQIRKQTNKQEVRITFGLDSEAFSEEVLRVIFLIGCFPSSGLDCVSFRFFVEGGVCISFFAGVFFVLGVPCPASASIALFVGVLCSVSTTALVCAFCSGISEGVFVGVGWVDGRSCDELVLSSSCERPNRWFKWNSWKIRYSFVVDWMVLVWLVLQE